MPKAKTLDRVALTKQKMEARERMKANAKPVIPEKYTTHAEICPECGGELEPWEGCKRCKKCGTSLCG